MRGWLWLLAAHRGGPSVQGQTKQSLDTLPAAWDLALLALAPVGPLHGPLSPLQAEVWAVHMARASTQACR